MPIFEYKCDNTSCNNVEERITNDPSPELLAVFCQKCGSMCNKIDISRSSFRLMPGGSGGFYSPSKG